jgi:hypothetical protein
MYCSLSLLNRVLNPISLISTSTYYLTISVIITTQVCVAAVV